MALLNREGEVIEPTTLTDDAPTPGGTALTALADWDPASGDGLLLAVDDEPEARFASAPLIAIEFPAFTDGRGLSLAVLLRSRIGFEGELRAIGDVHEDVIHYMKRCGFDTFLMPEGRNLPAAGNGTVSTLAPHSDYYQASVLQPTPAYGRIRRGA